MAKELQWTGPTGQTHYAVLTDAVGRWYNTAAPGFEAFDAAHWTDYDLAGTEFGASGVYAADMPAVAAGVYHAHVRVRAGGSPAASDTVLRVGSVEWDGAAVVPLASRLPTASYTAPPAAAAVAAAWGARELAAGVTADHYLQGRPPKVVMAADGLTATVYAADETTVIGTLAITRLSTSVGGVRDIDPA